MKLRPILLAAAALLAVACPAPAQMYKGVELVKADLITDAPEIVAGKPFTVGLRLRIAPHWHTYWEYSGDAGLPTRIEWKLPEGFQAGPLQWPVPEQIDSPGDIVNYGYSNETVLLTEITPPAKLPAGNLQIGATADWLVCEELCIPGKAELQLALGGGEAADVIKRYRALLPKKPGADGKYDDGVTYAKDAKGGATISLAGSFPSTPAFFPLVSAGEIGHPSAPVREADGSAVHATIPVVTAPAKVGGVFVFPEGKAYYVPTAAEVAVRAAAAPVAAAGGGGLWHFLLLGFVGGLILNVMPCVLPVISLKLFSFVKQANEDPARIWRMGLAYAAGVFAWFLGFAALVVGLKAAGHEVGYAFHLQNPWFILGLSALVFGFALNLLGVFEITLPESVSGVLGEASQQNEGYGGAFFQGVLATVLGSACTAPFFGAALGFAFAQRAPAVFAMFAAIAAGMSLPFVLLAARPGWLRFLPKPGVWMERVKQATGFLMLATVLWLLSILGAMRGADAVVGAGVLLLAVGAAGWIRGAFVTLSSSPARNWILGAVGLALVGLGGLYAQKAVGAPPGSAAAGNFQAQLDAALKTDQPVFVDFTAAWCVNCKVNERVVLSSAPVQQAFRDVNAAVITADWTGGDPAITAVLKRFGRAGVPLYVIYPADRAREPIVLPELLTGQLVLDGLKSATSGRALAAAR